MLKKVIMSFIYIINPQFAIYILAKKFILAYEGFSYSFQINGEERLLDALKHSDIRTVFDVGANVGDWTAIASRKFSNATIHSFEISLATFQTLSEKCKNNNRVFTNNFGLSDEKGEIEYKDYGENSGVNSLIIDAEFHDHFATPKLVKALCETGNDYCKKYGVHEIDFLKIDVEGAEHLVLNGFSDLLESGSIKVIQFEYGYTHSDAKFLIKDFYKLFEKYGYVLGPLKPNGVIFMEFDYALNDFNSGPNYVAVHKSCNALIQKVKGKPIKGYPRR
jgi:FkbM family methyltransferase